MSRWLKRLIVAGLVLLLVVGAGVAVLLATIDQQAYKSWLQDQVRERYARTLEIKGEIGLRVFPDIGLKVSGVTLSEPNSKEVFASIAQASVSVAIRPLLQRKVSIDQVTLDGLEVKAARDQQGKWNFSNLIGQPRPSAPAIDVNQASGPAAPPSMTVDIKKFELKQSSILVFDRSKSVLAVKNLNASVLSSPGGKDFDVQVSSSMEATGKAQADVNVKARVAVSDDFSQIAIKGPELKLSKGQQKGGQGLRQVELTLTADSLLSQSAMDRFSISNVVLRAKGLRGADRFEWTGDIPSLTLEREKLTAPALNGRLRADGANALDARYQISGLLAGTGAIDIRLAKFDVGLKQENRFYKVEAQTPLTVHGDNNFQAKGVKGSLNVADPGLPAGGVSLPIAGELSYDQRKDHLEWKLSTSFLKSPIDFSGKATQLGQSVPRVSGNLSMDVLDLNALNAFLDQSKAAGKSGQPGAQSKPSSPEQTPVGSVGSGKDTTPTAKVSSDGAEKAPSPQAAVGDNSKAPIVVASQTTSQPKPTATDLSWMKEVDLDLQLRAGRFVWQSLHASPLALHVTIQQGRAQLRSLQASLYGGTFSAEGELTNAKDLPVALKGRLNAVQVEPLIAALSGESMLGGVGTMTFDLKSSAVDGATLARNLNGAAQIDIKQGYIRGFDLNKGMDALADPAGRAKDVPLTLDKSQRTNFSVMQSQIQFGQGLAKLNKTNLSSSNLRITEGKPAQISLADGSLDIVAEVQFSGNIGVPGRKVAIQVRSLMVPLRITGPARDPQVRVHWQGMPEEALKQTLQQLLLQGVIGGDGGFVGVGKTDPSSGSGTTTPPNPARQLENVIKGLLGK